MLKIKGAKAQLSCEKHQLFKCVKHNHVSKQYLGLKVEKQCHSSAL